MSKRLVSICLGFMIMVGVSVLDAFDNISQPANAVYQKSNDHNDALKAIKRGEILSLGRIKSIVERQMEGKLIGERLRHTNRGWVYEVRLRGDDGKVMFAIVDAATGKIIMRR